MFRAGIVFSLIGPACAAGEAPSTSEAPPEPSTSAGPAERAPRGAGGVDGAGTPDRWSYDHARADGLGVDRLDAPFDQLTAPRALSHEGTGGTGRLWRPDDDCGFSADGFRMKGEWTSICYGAAPGAHPPWCDPKDDSQNERVDRVIDVKTAGGCKVLFDEHPFTQDQGCGG